MAGLSIWLELWLKMKPKFKVGDWVKVKPDQEPLEFAHGDPRGKTGQIWKIDRSRNPGNFPFKVKFKDGYPDEEYSGNELILDNTYLNQQDIKKLLKVKE